MHTNCDVLGDEGRKALDACVKVSIYGRQPENIKKYHWKEAWEKLDKCYAGWPPGLLWGRGTWLPHELLQYLMLPTEWDEYGQPDREKICDIIEIHDALKNFDEMPYVETYPKPGPGSDELKELIDRRRADVERECQEAKANPDARIQYSWLVAQRRVRDCFAGSFAGDAGLLQPKRDPNEPYNIVDIHDAVVHWNEKSFFASLIGDYDARNNKWWKKHTAERDDVERELKEAISTTDKVIKEYSRDEAEQRVKNCYGNFFDYQAPPDTPVLPNKSGNSGKVDQTHNIFDIHEALQQLDEKKLLQKYPDEGPGSVELTKSIEENNLCVKQEYEKATFGLCRYSHSEAEKRVRDCFVDALPKKKVIFPAEEDETNGPCSNKTYDIFDIHRRLLYFDETERNKTRKILKCTDLTKPEKVAKVQRDAVTKEYERAKSRLRKYSRNEAERRARDCFAGTVLRTPGDTDIFSTKEKKSGIPKTQQTYDIFDIKNAIIVHFDKKNDKKKLRDKYLAEKDPDSKCRNKVADEERAEIEAEYTKATEEMEIDRGSGFIIHDHFIITNKHVVEDALCDKAKKICISNEAIGELPCVVIHYDAGKDLALLYFQKLNLKQNGIFPMQLSNQPLLPGMQIFSFGYPVSHTDERALFVNGHVSGLKKTLSGHTMIVLNCSLNSGNSGGPILCWVSGQLKVVGVATQKHFKHILTLEEREKIANIRESLQTSTILGVPDRDIKRASLERERNLRPDPCQMPMFLLTLKLYDALETHSQLNLGNALPEQYVIEFVRETITKYNGNGKEELVEVIKWSEDRVNIFPSGHCCASKCCVQ